MYRLASAIEQPICCWRNVLSASNLVLELTLWRTITQIFSQSIWPMNIGCRSQFISWRTWFGECAPFRHANRKSNPFWFRPNCFKNGCDRKRKMRYLKLQQCYSVLWFLRHIQIDERVSISNRSNVIHVVQVIRFIKYIHTKTNWPLKVSLCVFMCRRVSAWNHSMRHYCHYHHHYRRHQHEIKLETTAINTDSQSMSMAFLNLGSILWCNLLSLP